MIFVITFLSSQILCLNLTKNHFKEMEAKFEELASELPLTRGLSSGDKEYRKALFFENVAEIEESNSKNDGRA